MRQTKRLWTTSKDQAIRFLKTSIAKAFANGSIKENQDYGYLSIFQLRPSPELSTYAFDEPDAQLNNYTEGPDLVIEKTFVSGC